VVGFESGGGVVREQRWWCSCVRFVGSPAVAA
jgi:hypothetical protein